MIWADVDLNVRYAMYVHSLPQSACLLRTTLTTGSGDGWMDGWMDEWVSERSTDLKLSHDAIDTSSPMDGEKGTFLIIIFHYIL